MKRALHKVELIANIGVILAALLFVSSVGWVGLRYSSRSEKPHSSIETGTKITLPDQDWSTSPQTLVLVLSADCQYCTASAPFYRRLVSKGLVAHSTRFLAVFPQAVKESREYLAGLGVKIDELQQAPPASVGAKGTPTLILVNASGTVVQSWDGLLPPNAETEVLAYLK